MSVPAKIIAAVNDRAEAEDAFLLASEFARLTDAELDVAAVLDYTPTPIDIKGYEVVLRRQFDQIFERLPQLEYSPHRLTSPSTPRALSELAETLEAEMIVLGSTHRGALGRVMPGSVGERLLSGGPCPIAIAPRGYRNATHRFERIGVGFDGGPEAGIALTLANQLATAAGTHLRLIAVQAPIPALGELTPPADYYETLREQLEATLEEGAARVTEAQAETALLAGDPASRLAEASAELDALVVGSRGYGPIRRALLGGVASPLMRMAECPTIVVPRGWKQPAP